MACVNNFAEIFGGVVGQPDLSLVILPHYLVGASSVYLSVCWMLPTRCFNQGGCTVSAQ